MSETIKSVFEDECRSLAIDIKLVKKLRQFNYSFISKNQEHIEFFGGNTTGVQVVRFLASDRDRWFDEIMEVNDGPLEERLLALPTVNEDWNISSDTMNLSCAWLTHAIMVSKLPDQQKHDAMIDVIMILQYKFLTSLLYRYFPYPADKAVAEATYAQLTYKYSLKAAGSWSALLLSRAEEVIAKTGIHYQTIVKMDKDEDVTYILNDTQGRIRDILKNIYRLFVIVDKQGIRMSTTSSIMLEHDGVEILKDRTKSVMNYGRYLNEIISDRNSFIRTELTSIIENMIHTMPPKLFLESLEWMSNNYRQSGAGVIEEVINETLLHTFDYLSHNRDLIKNHNDLSGLLSKLKGLYMSSRSTDPTLYSLREKVEVIVKKATSSKNESVLASVRTGVLLYLIIRSFTMKYYNTH